MSYVFIVMKRGVAHPLSRSVDRAASCLQVLRNSRRASKVFAGNPRLTRPLLVERGDATNRMLRSATAKHSLSHLHPIHPTPPPKLQIDRNASSAPARNLASQYSYNLRTPRLTCRAPPRLHLLPMQHLHHHLLPSTPGIYREDKDHRGSFATSLRTIVTLVTRVKRTPHLHQTRH